MPHKQGGGRDMSGGMSTATVYGTFRRGERVPETGEYACRTCSDKREMQHTFTHYMVEGETFPDCPGCSAGSFWERNHPRGM